MQLHAKGGVAARNTLLALLLASGTAQAGTLTIESWRVDDKTLWETVLIPAFQKRSGIEIKFSPTAPRIRFHPERAPDAAQPATCWPADRSTSRWPCTSGVS